MDCFVFHIIFYVILRVFNCTVIETQSYKCEVCGQNFSSRIAKAGHQRSAKCSKAKYKRGWAAARVKAAG